MILTYNYSHLDNHEKNARRAKSVLAYFRVYNERSILVFVEYRYRIPIPDVFIVIIFLSF